MQREIDHLVVAVKDLANAAEFYRRLGFQVGARNRHPWGTENHIVQFESSFIELIALGKGVDIAPHKPGVFSFGAFIKEYLAYREGLAMLVLRSQDAKADAGYFAKSDIGSFEPFFFEREGRRPDDSEMRVAFTLAFAQLEGAPLAGFFVCQQHFPENFWNAAFQRHENGAESLASVTLAAPKPEQSVAFLSKFTGSQPSNPDADDFSYPLDGAHIDLMTPDDAGEVYASVEAELDQPSFVAFSVRVADLKALSQRFDHGAIPYQHIGSRLIVPASAAFGVAIAFEEA